MNWYKKATDIKNFLCIVYDPITSITLQEYTVEAADFYYASHIAANKFEKEQPTLSKEHPNWKVDYLEL